jgi:hypothetical protein
MKNSVYVRPFKSAMHEIGVDPMAISDIVLLNREKLEQLIKILLRAVTIDEDWYRKTYPDVDAAIKDGVYKSAKHHFVENGYFEGRRAGMTVVDEDWYRQAYPDIAEGIELGQFASCQEHFDQHGEAEGRLPMEF